MKNLLLLSVLAVSLSFLSGCSTKNDACTAKKVVYPDCVPCTTVSPAPCTPCKN